jgi:hypothetical protein
MPPSGKYLPRITLVDAMAINFGIKMTCGVVKTLSKASNQKAQS